MTDKTIFNMDIRRVPWTAVGSAIVLAGSGFLAWDDLGDSVKAQAQSLIDHTEVEANAFIDIWEEMDDLGESLDETEEGVELLQRRLLEINGQQKTTVAEIRGDVKLILRLLEERQ